MMQAIVLLLIIFIISIIWSEVKQHRPAGSKKQGEVIDISGAWVDSSKLPYRLKERMLNEAELDLYNLLLHVLQGSMYMVCPKVQLAEIVDLSSRAENRQEYLKRIRTRTIDLLLCELPRFTASVAISLEDRSSNKKDKLADRFMANAIKAAGLPHLIYDRSNLPDERQLLFDLADAGLIVSGSHLLSD